MGIGAKSKIKTLLARDGNLCWLCGEPFSRQSGRKPSLDHVIPRSKGGSNANSNLKLAHGRCNWARGDNSIVVIADQHELSAREGFDW